MLYVGGHPCQGQVLENRVGSKDSGVVQIHFCRELLLNTQGQNDKTICQSEAKMIGFQVRRCLEASSCASKVPRVSSWKYNFNGHWALVLGDLQLL